MKKIIFIVFASLTLFGCSKADFSEENVNKNDSKEYFEVVDSEIWDLTYYFNEAGNLVVDLILEDGYMVNEVVPEIDENGDMTLTYTTEIGDGETSFIINSVYEGGNSTIDIVLVLPEEGTDVPRRKIKRTNNKVSNIK